MLRYKLRTLLLLLAILPPLLGVAWVRYSAWREAERQRVERERMQQQDLVEVEQLLTGKFLTGSQPATPQPTAPAKAEEH